MPENKTAIVVDPVSTGFNLAMRLETCGVKVISVWSGCLPDDLKSYVVPGYKPVNYVATFDGAQLSLDELVTKYFQKSSS